MNDSQPDTRKFLLEHFQYEKFLPGQEEVIGHLLSGHSAAAVFPTGGGKSLCYQLTSLLLPGLTLVVSPLIALMKDQIDALTARGIAAARLDSTLSADANRNVVDQIRSGALRMLYVAPERFTNERFRETIQRVDISLFAVDEAHCISEWGHSFRPDYLKLAQFAKACRADRVLALTATATPKVLDDICRLFEIEPKHAVRTGFYRSNLTLLTTPVSVAERDSELLARLQKRPPGPTIVYVTLQRTSEEVAEMLNAGTGFEAKAYHAGMDNPVRSAVQDWFMKSDSAIVVATIAFGMGIDKSNIRYVYHYNMPKSLENYSQEIGRSGRDGKPSTCELFLCPDDVNVLENFIFGDTPIRESLDGFVTGIFTSGEHFDVSLHELSGQYDIRILVVRTLLTYLELDGYLEGGTPFYSTFQFKPLVTSKQILSQFEGERQEFLKNLFRQASKSKTWFHLDVDQAASALETDRNRIVRALDYLGEKQWLEVRSAGVRFRYKRIRAPKDFTALSGSLHKRMMDREAGEINRLNQVIDLVRQDNCQVAFLGSHFGEELEKACGHCSRCLDGSKAVQLAERPTPPIGDAIWDAATKLRAQHPDTLGNTQLMARFLCGVTSPKLTRAKLTKDELFGALSHVPFLEVLKRAGEDKPE